MNKIMLFLIISFTIVFRTLAQQCVLDPPNHLKVTDITSCSATLNWGATLGAVNYKVKYRLSPGGTWSPAMNAGNDTFFTFTGLLAGKNYDFSVQAKCADGSKSAAKKKNASTTICTQPADAEVQTVDGNTVKISVSLTCPVDTIRYRYRPLGGTWISKYVVNTTTITISNLDPSLTYLY